MTPWLSILIPAHNVAAYLPECLQSILNQSMQGVELILVDDCSTDATLELMQQFAERYPNTIQLRQHATNMGVSAARNTLLQHATGQYIWFFDADDVMDAKAIARLRQITQQHQPDMVLCDFQLLRQKMHLKHKLRGELHRPSFTGKSYQLSADQDQLLAGLFQQGQFHLWSKICHHRVWQQDIAFPQGRLFEDVAVTPLLAMQAQSYYYAPECWVQYRQRPGSILSTKNPAFLSKKNQDLVWALQLFNQQFQARKHLYSEHTCMQIGYFCSRNFVSACKKTDQKAANYQQLLAEYTDALRHCSPVSLKQLLTFCVQAGWWLRAGRLYYWLRKANRNPLTN